MQRSPSRLGTTFTMKSGLASAAHSVITSRGGVPCSFAPTGTVYCVRCRPLGLIGARQPAPDRVGTHARTLCSPPEPADHMKGRHHPLPPRRQACWLHGDPVRTSIGGVRRAAAEPCVLAIPRWLLVHHASWHTCAMVHLADIDFNGHDRSPGPGTDPHATDIRPDTGRHSFFPWKYNLRKSSWEITFAPVKPSPARKAPASPSPNPDWIGSPTAWVYFQDIPGAFPVESPVNHKVRDIIEKNTAARPGMLPDEHEEVLRPPPGACT